MKNKYLALVEDQQIKANAVYKQIVTDKDGKVTTWALEGTNPDGLRRTGWDLTAFKAGTQISARCHQLKDGSSGCLLGFITMDGVEKSFD